jgi:multidrug resistance protein, MATE family
MTSFSLIAFFCAFVVFCQCTDSLLCATVNSLIPTSSSWVERLRVQRRSMVSAVEQSSSLTDPSWFRHRWNSLSSNRNTFVVSKSILEEDSDVDVPGSTAVTTSAVQTYQVSNSQSKWMENFEDHLSSLSILPCGDAFDRKISRLVLPAVLHYAIGPLVAAADTFWVSRLLDPLAVAGQGAACSVYNSLFWVLSFLPSVITPLVAKAAGSGDNDAVSDRVSEAFVIAGLTGITGSYFLTSYPDKAISVVLYNKASSREFAVPYLRTRAMALSPALLSIVCFAVFRGTLDVVTPLKISLISNLVSVALDPIFIFWMGMGATGAATATALSDVLSLSLYVRALMSRGALQFSKLLKIPSFLSITPLLLSGLSMQLRAVALHTSIISIARVIHALDSTGAAAAAHSIALHSYLLGCVPAMALSMAASILIPVELVKAKATGQKAAVRQVRRMAMRIALWGIFAGLSLCILQLAFLTPFIHWLTPLSDIRVAARSPTSMAAVVMFVNSLVLVVEGLQQGTQSFLPIAVVTTIGTGLMLLVLKHAAHSVTTVWASYLVLAGVRLSGSLLHLLYFGSLSTRMINSDSSLI